jgi:acyl-CoA synthetase (AMP-forming)/AMP-acid ligase II
MRIRAADGQICPAGEIGEIQFRGGTVIPGYWRDPAATAAAIDAGGWLATGDLGRTDAAGNLFLVDRTKEVIIRGGYNVYPREVEEALYAHPDVREAAVVGTPHDALARSGAGRRRSACLRRRAGRCLQVPAPDRVHGRAPQERHGKGAEAHACAVIQDVTM